MCAVCTIYIRYMCGLYNLHVKVIQHIYYCYTTSAKMMGEYEKLKNGTVKNVLYIHVHVRQCNIHMHVYTYIHT